MTLKNRVLDRLALDDLPTYAELKAAMLALYPVYLPELTDLNAAAPQVRLTDLVAVFFSRHAADLLIDGANESFLPVAASYDWVALRARELGYYPDPGNGATATVTLTRLTASATPTTILRVDFAYYTKKSLNQDRVRFELAATSATLPAGAAGTSVLVGLIQGTAISDESPTGADGETATCDGSDFQRLYSARGRCYPGYEVLYIDGEAWAKASGNNLLRHGSADKVYELWYTEDGRAVFQFGAFGYGAAPTGTPTLAYRTITDGLDGNVPAGSIIQTSPSTSVFSVTNATAASGWRDAEGIETIRFKASRQIRINADCCSAENTEANVEDEFSDVGRCYVVDGDRGENTIGVYVCGNLGEDLDASDLADIKAWVDASNPATERVFCGNVETQEIALGGVVYVRDGYGLAEVETAVEAALDAHFSPLGVDAAGNRTLDPGMPVYVEDIEAVINGVAGVRRVVITSPTGITSCVDNALPSVASSLTYEAA